MRATSLGRPSAAYLLRQASWWPSESLLVAGRLALACLLPGALATLLGNDHVYWAVSFAALIVTAGGSRRAQATKALHRVLGTAAGLGVYAVLLRLDLHGWWMVAVVITLQFVVELLVTRHYALAVSALTPLALTISAELTDMPTETVVGDRVLDTALGVGSALLVLVLSGLFGREVVLRAHARRVAVAVDAVLRGLTEGRHRRRGRATPAPGALRRAAGVGRGGSTRARGRTGAHRPYREMERTRSHVGYLVLGAAWHPRVAADRDRFGRARQALAVVIGRPVRVRRPADELTAELQEVERVLTGER